MTVARNKMKYSKNVGKDSALLSGGKIRLKVLTRPAELRLDKA